MFRHAAIACITTSMCLPMSLRAEKTAQPVSTEKLSAAQIVDKNVAARGGLQAWRSVQALTMSGKMQAGGNNRSALPMPGRRSGAAMPPPRPTEQVELPFVMEMKRPHKSRLELQVKGQTAIQAFDGSNGWKLRPFLGRNAVEPYNAEELKIASAESDLDGLLIDYAAKGTKVELEGTEKVGDQDAYKLKLTLQDGQVRRVWIDSENFLDIKVDGVPRRMDGRMHAVEIYNRDFRPENGLMVPHLIETEVQGFQPTHKMTIEKVVVNPRLDDARFTRPPQAPVAATPKAKQP